MSVLFFDTETGDLPDHRAPHTADMQPDIVQLAAILRDDDGREMASINLILNTDRAINPGAQNVHGISKEITERMGVSAINAIYVFRDMLANARTVVAHNIAFDKKVVNTCLFRQEVPPVPWEKMTERDTMLSSVNVCRIKNARGNGFKWPKLSEAYWHFFKEKIDGAHDALVDVRACIRIYDELLRINAFPAIPQNTGVPA